MEAVENGGWVEGKEKRFDRKIFEGGSGGWKDLKNRIA